MRRPVKPDVSILRDSHGWIRGILMREYGYWIGVACLGAGAKLAEFHGALGSVKHQIERVVIKEYTQEKRSTMTWVTAIRKGA